MLEIRRSIQNFFLLVLGALSNATPSDIHINPWVWTQPKTKELFFRLDSNACIGTNKDWSCHKRMWLQIEYNKRGAVGAHGAGDIKIILAACGFGTTGLSLEEQVYPWLVTAQKFSLLYLTEAAIGTRFPALLNTRVPCLKESPRASELLCPNTSVASRFCKSKILVPLLWSGVWYHLIESLQIGWLTRWVWRN